MESMIGIEISINGEEPIIGAAENHLVANFSFGYSEDMNFVIGFEPSHTLRWCLLERRRTEDARGNSCNMDNGRNPRSRR